MTDMLDVNRVLQIAQQELGYCPENKKNKYLEATNYFGLECGWCASFIQWCFIQAYGFKMASEMLYCNEKLSPSVYKMRRAFKENKNFIRIGKDAKIGDLIFIKPDDQLIHVGLIVSHRNNHTTIIAGDHLNRVSQSTYVISRTRIDGYGIVDYKRGDEQWLT